MSGSAYTSVDELKKTLTLQGTVYADYDLGPAVTAASDALNELCNRKFDRDTSAVTTRYYTPSSGENITIDDCIEVVSLFCDQDSDGDHEQEFTVGSDFALWPFNALADDRPYTQIKLNSFRAINGFPYWAVRGAAVEGKFGWPELPSFLEVAAKMLAAKLIKRMREAPFGIVTVGLDVGSAMRIGRTDPDIQMLIENFVRERVV
jgi:hypothetical protein